MATSERQQAMHVEPVFFVSAQLPANDQKNYTTSEICAAAEKVCGYESMYGAQRIGGLWRLYPTKREHRDKILVQGLILRGIRVTARERNPYNTTTKDGSITEKPSTKVIIGNVPLSFDHEEISKALQSLGCELRSQLFEERDRDSSGRLTRWKTGRRFAYITVPSKPLSKQLMIGPFKAIVYHREQKQVSAEATCSKCFRKGHTFSTCSFPMKCRQCYRDGHKAGDEECRLFPEMPEDRNNQEEKEEETPKLDQQMERPATPHRGRSKDRKRHDAVVSEAAKREGSSAKRPRAADWMSPTDFDTSLADGDSRT